MKTLLGKKIGMTQIFAEDGTVVPVTVIRSDMKTRNRRESTSRSQDTSQRLALRPKSTLLSSSLKTVQATK